jgi:hypothetical protein
MKKRKVLTKEYILKDYKYIRMILLFSIFFIVGLGVFLSPLTFWEGDITKLLINMGATLVLVVPFCYFIAYRNIADIVRRVHGIRNDQIVIVEDVVVDKWSRMRDGGGYSCQIELQDYAKRTGKVVWVESREYSRAKKGDVYFAVYVQSRKKDLFFGVYSAKEYELDDSLQRFLKRANL